METPKSNFKKIQVLVDHRESQSGIIEVLKQFPDLDVQRQQLNVGDYQFDGRWYFERKTILDFAQSIIDGRLFSQACRLKHDSYPTAIILEGSGKELQGTEFKREAVQGAIISLTLVFGIPVLRSLDPAETARLMIYAAKQLRRHGLRAFPASRKRAKSKRKIQARILEALPGVGPERAEVLLNRFGSVQAVMSANQQDLQSIEGIGEKVASRIRSVLQEESSCYDLPI